MDEMITDLERLKSQGSNQTVIPTIKLFAVGESDYIDLMSRNTGKSYTAISSTHLVNRRSFEIFEDKINTRYDSIKDNNSIQAIILELTVDNNNR